MKDFLDIMEEGERLVTSIGEQSRQIPNFDKKLDRFIRLLANESGLVRHKREFLLKEAASTSDFPILFGTVLERTLLAKYNAASPDWQAYIKTGTQNDFRPADAIGVYGLEGGLNEVKQRGEYKQDAQMGEGKISISLKKYGRLFGLGWETIINDDLGALSDISERLAKAARRTEYREATKLLASATGPNSTLFAAGGTHPIDKKAFTNLGALPLTQDNLGTVMTAMRNQLDADGEPIIIEGFHVVVPPALEIPLLKILSPGSLIMSGGDGQAGVKPVITTSTNVLVQKYNITPHVNPYLPIVDVSAKKATTWYVFADLGSGFAAKLNFLRGHESPELCMKNPDKISVSGGQMSAFEGDFKEDAMWWRVRHILGGTQFDPRMAYAQTGS